MLSGFEEKAGAVAAQALYQGAGIMAQAIEKEVWNIRTAPFKWASKRRGETRLPSPEEVDCLKGSVGIAKFDKNGSEVNTSIGFQLNGYVSVKWRRMWSTVRTNYKQSRGKLLPGLYTIRSSEAVKRGERNAQNQKPIAVIANSINSGTSFMKKQPFVRKAVSKATRPAMAVMIRTIEQAFEEKNGG